MAKAFLILRGSCREPCYFADFRKLAEKIIGYWGRKINRYGILYYDSKSQVKQIARPYKEIDYKKQDDYSIPTITMCDFLVYPRKKGVLDASRIGVCFNTFFGAQNCTASVTWENDTFDKKVFQQEMKDVLEMLFDFFSIDNVFADCMDHTKSVDLFVHGIAVETEHFESLTRSNYENKIAKNINQYINHNGKIPYLFAYTSVRKAPDSSQKEDLAPIEFVNLDLLEKDLEAYSEDPAWNQCYRDWIEKGIIAPLQSN